MLIEAAHFDPASIARTARRHKLPSEASRRFERGVDPTAAGRRGPARGGPARCCSATARPTRTSPSPPRSRTPAAPIIIDAALPGRVAGLEYPRETVVRRLQEVGCAVEGADAARA